MDIYTVAHRASVSTATVSRVLNSSNKVRESTAERVRKAMVELDYVPNSAARLLRSGRSNLYGIIVSDIRNPFFPDLIERFELLASQHGINVTFVSSSHREEQLLCGVRRLVERGIDGLAVLTSEVSAKALTKIRQIGIPVVLLNQPSVVEGFHKITVDYFHGFCIAIEHLHMLGHKRIGFVAGPSTLGSAARPERAFVAAMKANDLASRDEWMFQGDHWITGGQYAAERLFAMKTPPTAVICSNDMTAIGLLHSANRLGRKVPQELSLIGFDDLFLCEIVQPALTTLHLSRQEIATRAFFALQGDRETGNGTARAAMILPRLVIRASTGVAS